MPGRQAAAANHVRAYTELMSHKKAHLPSHLCKQGKAQDSTASPHRLGLLAETDRYVEELVAEVGEPTPMQRMHAAAVALRLARRPLG
jgi:hypothetical protein